MKSLIGSDPAKLSSQPINDQTDLSTKDKNSLNAFKDYMELVQLLLKEIDTAS